MNTRSTLFYILAVCLLLGGADTATAGYGLILTVPPALAHRDVTPDPFGFAPRSNVPKSTYIKSDTITVKGFNRVLNVKSSDPIIQWACQVSINNGPFQYTDGQAEVKDGQQITLRLESSSFNGTSTSCTVKVGETASTFTVTTAIPPPVKTCASGPQTVEWKGETWQRCDNGWDYADPEKAREYCDNLNLGGYYDWMMPMESQMPGLIVCDNGNTSPASYGFFSGGGGCAYDKEGNYYGPYSSPTIDPVFQAEPTPYWFRFPLFGMYGTYSKLDFATGSMYYNGPYNAGKIRCVRRWHF